MDIEFINSFYAGRVYQFYLDNEEELLKGYITELNFLVPKIEGIEISKLKKILKNLIGDNTLIKCSATPKRNGWRFNFKIIS